MNRPITTARATLLAHVLPERRLAHTVAIAVVGSLMLALSAKVQVPFWPVPMTMQTLVVLVLGAALGARLGAATVLVYLAEGAMGLPVFAGTPEKGIGLAYMFGPTGGYLVGFVLAAFLVGWLAERGWDRSVLRLFAAMTLGHVVILALGFAWLAGLIGIEKAWLLGVVPFIAATVLKTALGALALPAAWKSIAR
ncbi:MAG: biotin transporter BioY [Hyphomicrobiaceae bacterium]